MPPSQLPEKKKPQFTEDAKVMGIPDLAKKYKIRERTANNWRIKLVGPRKGK